MLLTTHCVASAHFRARPLNQARPSTPQIVPFSKHSADNKGKADPLPSPSSKCVQRLENQNETDAPPRPSSTCSGAPSKPIMGTELL